MQSPSRSPTYKAAAENLPLFEYPPKPTTFQKPSPTLFTHPNPQIITIQNQTPQNITATINPGSAALQNTTQRYREVASTNPSNLHLEQRPRYTGQTPRAAEFVDSESRGPTTLTEELRAQEAITKATAAAEALRSTVEQAKSIAAELQDILPQQATGAATGHFTPSTSTPRPPQDINPDLANPYDYLDPELAKLVNRAKFDIFIRFRKFNGKGESFVGWWRQWT